MKSATILGLMSGTSLDGLDLCLAKFDKIGNDYKFKILGSVSYSYSENWQERLKNATELPGQDLKALDNDLGNYFGELVNEFLDSGNLKPDYIASHGHTVFHQPRNRLTHQIGNGYAIHSKTGIPVIYDFRSLDVARNGHGAPLVPIGDLHLFNEHKACINFGGIANISFQKNNERLAFDICPVNMALSDLTSELGLPYDDRGEIAKKGNINPELLDRLNALDYYEQQGPKSLGVEWYNEMMKPLLKQQAIPVENRLRTTVEHIGFQVTKVLDHIDDGEVLITGGGVYNDFLVERLRAMASHQIVVPDQNIIEFKEALIFAFLGWLRHKWPN